MARKKSPNQSPRVVNRRAKHDYDILETLECGIELRGSEVKAIREGRCSIAEGYVAVDNRRDELMAYNIDIGDYSNAPPLSHEPKRPRRLLAHRREIERLRGLTTGPGITMVPLTLFFNKRGFAKLDVGVARGKRRQDKREEIKKKEADQTIRRAMSKRKIG